MRTLLLGAAAALALLVGTPALAETPSPITVTKIGTYATGIYEKSAAEIATYEPTSKRLFVVNGANEAIDVLDLADPRNPRKVTELKLAQFGSAINSVATHNGLLAAAVAGPAKTDPGKVVFFNPDGTIVKSVTVGALPDMVTFTPDGRYVLTADEGEPNEEVTIDPEGSISIIDISRGIHAESPVRRATFTRFNGRPVPEGMRIGRTGATFAQDMEPEYIAITPDSRTAVVTLQENNGIAIVDIQRAEVTRVVGLGFVDRRTVAFDPSDRDGGIKIGNWPVLGMYQPDSITGFQVGGEQFYVIANEGDARDWKGFSEEKRVSELRLDPTAFPNAADLQKNDQIGRLRVTNQLGDTDGDGDFDQLYTFGSRSFSVLDANGRLIWDSGEEFERILASRLPRNFNSGHTNNTLDDRSDDKGPEPEGITVATIAGVPYAFIGLERVSGMFVYSLQNPRSPRFVDYVNDRDFAQEPKDGRAGDLGPEGLMTIPAAVSPNGQTLVVVTNEVSGSTSIFEVRPR